MIKEEAYAKINLSLDIVGKRPDGYHEVCMIMQTIDLHDTLTFEECDEGIVLVTDSEELNAESDSGKDNLIVKAAKALFLRKGENRGVKITLTKRIPIAAGMAGGSTDAAAALRGINRLFGYGLSDEELEEIGVKLGADVPYCVKGGTKLSEGIGEVLTELPTPVKTALVICKPPVNISTKEVYEKYDALKDPFHPDVKAMVEAIKAGESSKIPGLCGNSLEKVTKEIYPRIGEIERFFEENGAIRAVMTGSGPTVFAFVPKEDQARIESLAKERFPDCYVKGHFYG